MYTIKLINPMQESGYEYWTVLVTDDTGAVPNLRFDVKFGEGADKLMILKDKIETMAFEATRPPVEYDEEGLPLPQGPGLVIDVTGCIATVDNIGGEQTQWQF
jgi:hypothetical protein